MVEIRKRIEAQSKIGKQGNTLRMSIPKEIVKYIKVKYKDTAKWILYLDTDKPEIRIEIIEAEEECQQK